MTVKLPKVRNNLLEQMNPEWDCIVSKNTCFQQMGTEKKSKKKSIITVCNFQSMKSPLELNSLFSKFFCYITWFISPDQTLQLLLANEALRQILFEAIA